MNGNSQALQMSRRSRRKKSIRKSSSGIGLTAVVIAALIWIIPAAGGYVLYKLWNDETAGPVLSQTSSGSRLSPVTSVSLVSQGQVDQLEVSSALILSPESGELYNRIAAKQRQAEQQFQEIPASEPAVAAVEILGPRWLLEQSDNAFTIQYLTSASMDELVDFSEKFTGEAPATIYPYRQSDGIVEYGLARGIFDSLDSAREALQAQPQELQLHNPWIRPISKVSGQIRKFISQ